MKTNKLLFTLIGCLALTLLVHAFYLIWKDDNETNFQTSRAPIQISLSPTFEIDLQPESNLNIQYDSPLEFDLEGEILVESSGYNEFKYNGHLIRTDSSLLYMSERKRIQYWQIEGLSMLLTNGGVVELATNQFIVKSDQGLEQHRLSKYASYDMLNAKLVFENAPLEKVFSDVSKLYGAKIFPNKSLVNKTFTGQFINRDIAGILRSIKRVHYFKIQNEGGRIILSD